MLSRLAATLLAVALCAGGAFAQSGFWVDPLNGNDANSGSAASPFRTIGHAMGAASLGQTVWLYDGTYDSVSGETFPIDLKNQVNLRAEGLATPVIDGGGAGLIFRVQENYTALTRIDGLTVLDGVVLIGLQPGVSVRGLVVEDCAFEQFSETAVDLPLSSGGAQEVLVVENCTFAGAGAPANAVRIALSGATVLSGGGVLECTVNGGVARGVQLTATGAARSVSGFEIARNTFEGYTVAGVELAANGGGNNPIFICEIDGRVDANRFVGTADEGSLPSGEAGLRLLATRGTNGEGGIVSAEVAFNDFNGNDFNIYARTTNANTAQADIVSDFFGNKITNASQAGVELIATLPNPGLPDCDPDFGDGNQADRAGANTFTGNALDFRMSLEVDQISARHNWFTAGAPSVSGGSINSSSPLSEPLAGTFSSDAPANQISTATLTAAAGTRFVDYDDDGARGQISVIVDGVVIDQDDLIAPLPGQVLAFGVPSLSAGPKQVTIINPGGQVGLFTLQIVASGGGSGGGGGEDSSGCFVATAAHGDYESAEVRELRVFRDQYLQANGPGRAFIRWYYEEGPAAAAWIAERPAARAGARAMLQAPVGLAAALNTWNPGQRLGAAVLLLGLAFSLRRRR